MCFNRVTRDSRRLFKHCLPQFPKHLCWPSQLTCELKAYLLRTVSNNHELKISLFRCIFFFFAFFRAEIDSTSELAYCWAPLCGWLCDHV